MAAIATVTGTAIRPGISKNNRKYTAEAIGSMVKRAQARIDDPDGMPITMLSHHGAEDDSTRIVGQVRRIWQEADGSARFEAAIDDTPHGHTIASLADPAGRDKPTLKGVSIRGAWLGKVHREPDPDAGVVERGSDLELDGLDFTRKPGVTGAGVDSVDFVPAQPRESDGTARVPITESAPEATVTISEADDPSDGGPFADPGYQKDKKKRYPLDTKKRAKAAWSYINQADNARLYTSAQLKRVKARIVKALKGYGVTVATQERWLIDPAATVTEALAECWDMEPGADGSLYLSLTNGPTTVTVSSRILDPHDLDAVGRAAMAGACDALMSLDPDMDADIDVPGAEPEDDDNDADSTDEPGSACSCGCGCAVPHPMAVADGCPCACGCTVCHAADDSADESAPQTPAPDPAAETPTQETEPAMAESTTPAAETPGSDSGIDVLSAKFDTLIGAIGGLVTAMAPKPVEAAPAPAAPAVESAPASVPIAETTEQMVARLVAEGVKAALPQAVQETVERQGPPPRKGLVAPVAESDGAAPAEPGFNQYGAPADWPNKPLHQYSPDERTQYFGTALRQHVLKDRFRG